MLFLAVLMLITYGSLGSGEEAAKINVLNFPNSDKVIHGLMYFVLTGSLIYLLMHHFDTFMHWKIYLVVLGSPIVYGLLMEVLQYMLTPDRQAELLDFVANVVGTTVAFLMALGYYKMKNAT